MTREQIEQAAERYIKAQEYSSLEQDDIIFAAFVAGAKYRQAEVEELLEDYARSRRIRRERHDYLMAAHELISKQRRE